MAILTIIKKTGYEILDLSEIESVELLIRYEDMTWK